MHKRWCGLLLVISVCLAAPSAVLALDFDRFTTIEDVGTPDLSFVNQAILLVDINNDTNLDLVALDGNSTVIKIYLGDGAGHFGAPTEIELEVTPTAVAATDLRGNGHTDFVVVSNGDEVLLVLLQGDDPLTYEVRTVDDENLVAPVGVAVAEYSATADGLPDIAVVGLNTDEDQVTVSVYRNNGDGNFAPFATPSVSYAGSDPQAVVTGDFSRDGRPDLAIINFAQNGTGGRLGQLVLTGDGVFESRAPQPNLGAEAEPQGLALADFNRDDNLDLASVDHNEQTEAAFKLLLGQGNGTFRLQGAQSEAIPEPFPDALAAGDFDLNGFDDVILTQGEQSGTGELSLLLNQGKDDNNQFLGFARANDVGLEQGEDSIAVAVGDVNHDNRPDVAVMMANNQVRILLNFEEPPTITPGGPSLTPTVTVTGTPPTATNTRVPSTQTPTPTPTPIPFAPYGFCDRALTTGRPEAIIAADFSGDRRPDIAIADAANNQVLVVLNTNDLFSVANCNSSTPLSVVAYPTGTDPRAMAMGDLDGDGIADIAVATSVGVNILKGSGTGTFSDGGTLTGGSDPRAILIAPINRDALADIVTGNAGSSDLSIFYRKAGGGFEAAQSIVLGRQVTSIVAGQFDHDGDTDLAAASGDIKVLLQDASAPDGFRKETGFGSGAPINALVAADFNGDLVIDLGVARADGSAQGTAQTYQGTLLNSGDPVYDPEATVVAGNQPQAEVAADLDRVGRIDLVVANKASDSLTFAKGNGSGQFPIQLLPFAVGEAPVALAVADIDGDGMPDVVVANEGRGGAGSISILISSRPPPTPTSPPTNTPTSTGTPTPQGSATATFTGTIPTITRTPSKTPTQTPALTATVTPSRTATKVGIVSISGPACNLAPESGPSLVWPAALVALALISRRRRLLLLVPLALSLDVRAASAQQALPQYRACYVFVGAATTRGAIGDFDRNGTPDLAVLTTGDSGFVLLTNRSQFAAGNCNEAVTISTIAPGSVPSGIVASDVDFNGKLDLAVTSRSGVTVLNGDGAGGFTSSGPLPTPIPPTPGISNPKDVAAANLNPDVLPDLIVADGSGIVLLYNNGNGSFRVFTRLSVSDAVVRVGAADFNRDGLIDVIGLDESGTATVFVQNEDGNFAQAATATVGQLPVDMGIAVTSFVDGIATFDFDRNDVPDLAFARQAGVSAFVGTLSQSSSLRYDMTSDLPAGRPSGININDFNGDTTLDVVAGDESQTQILFFLGDGEGGLGNGMPFQIDTHLGGTPSGILSADVDGDGRPDVIALSDASPEIAFFLSSNPPIETQTPLQTQTPTLTRTQSATVSQTPTLTPTLGPNDCCACNANMCALPTGAACPAGCTARYDSACVALGSDTTACFANTPKPTQTPTETPTITETPTVTLSPTSTSTPLPTTTPNPGPNDCCICGSNMCTAPTGGGCPTGCTVNFDAACAAGACVTNTPTATATPTLGSNDCCICAGNTCTAPLGSLCPTGCTPQVDSACATNGACVLNTATPTLPPTGTPTPSFTVTRTSAPTNTPTATLTLTPTETPVVAFALQGTGCTAGSTGGAAPWAAALAGIVLLRRRHPRPK